MLKQARVVSTNLDLSLVSLALWSAANRVRITAAVLGRVLHLVRCGAIRRKVGVDDVVVALSPWGLGRLGHLLLETVLPCAMLAYRSFHTRVHLLMVNVAWVYRPLSVHHMLLLLATEHLVST